MKDGLVDRAEVLRIIQEARESGGTDLRSIRALVEYLPVATPPAAPVAARIAKDVVNEILNVPRFVRNPEDTIIEIENKVAAIITRHLAGETSEPHCWHCGTILEAVELKLRCDQCPADCDDETCSAFGCAPNGGVSTAPVHAAGDDEDKSNYYWHGPREDKK